MLRENHVNIESKILELTIYLYRCYEEHEAPSSYNTTVYLSWLLHKEEVLGGNFTLGEFTAVNMKNCVCHNVRKHRDIKGSDKYVPWTSR